MDVPLTAVGPTAAPTRGGPAAESGDAFALLLDLLLPTDSSPLPEAAADAQVVPAVIPGTDAALQPIALPLPTAPDVPAGSVVPTVTPQLAPPQGTATPSDTQTREMQAAPIAAQPPGPARPASPATTLAVTVPAPSAPDGAGPPPVRQSEASARAEPSGAAMSPMPLTAPDRDAVRRAVAPQIGSTVQQPAAQNATGSEAILPAAPPPPETSPQAATPAVATGLPAAPVSAEDTASGMALSSGNGRPPPPSTPSPKASPAATQTPPDARSTPPGDPGETILIVSTAPGLASPAAPEHRDDVLHAAAPRLAADATTAPEAPPAGSSPVEIRTGPDVAEGRVAPEFAAAAPPRTEPAGEPPPVARAAASPAWPARQLAPFAVALALGPDASLTVTLDPAELGRVEVAIERSGGEARISLSAERPETLMLLQRDRAELERALSAAGFSGDSGGPALSFGGQGADQQRHRHDPRGTPRAPPPVPAAAAPPRAATRSLLDLAI